MWEDQDIKFDLSFSEMDMRKGEMIIDKLDFIEDTKGNSGDKGRLLRLKGLTEALHILTKHNSIRYEFIFTNLIPGNSRHFTSVMGIYKAYQSSRLYRELKLRGSIVHNKQLKMLNKETLYFTENGIWNLSSDQGNLGTFVITNVRVVWFADMNETFNVSLPYIQISTIRIRDSRFGLALVIESTLESGGYVLGFRIDPSERLQNICNYLRNLHRVHTEHPEFGVNYSQTPTPLLPEMIPIKQEEAQEFDETLNDLSNALATYSLDSEKDGAVSEPVYCPELGLAIEKLKDGYTIKTLWEVVPSLGNMN